MLWNIVPWFFLGYGFGKCDERHEDCRRERLEDIRHDVEHDHDEDHHHDLRRRCHRRH